MKIPETTYNVLLEAISAIVDHEGGAIAVKRSFSMDGLSELRMMWYLYHIATRNIMYDDTHPLYKNGSWIRAYPYQPNWNIYSLGVNDDHIDTALRKICRDLDLQFTR